MLPQDVDYAAIVAKIIMGDATVKEDLKKILDGITVSSNIPGLPQPMGMVKNTRDDEDDEEE